MQHFQAHRRHIYIYIGQSLLVSYPGSIQGALPITQMSWLVSTAVPNHDRQPARQQVRRYAEEHVIRVSIHKDAVGMTLNLFLQWQMQQTRYVHIYTQVKHNRTNPITPAAAAVRSTTYATVKHLCTTMG